MRISPLQIENPSNPSSWYKGATDLLIKAQRQVARTESDLTRGILDADSSVDPYKSRQDLFAANAVIGMMYDLFKYIIEMAKQNKEALKDTFGLAKAA